MRNPKKALALVLALAMVFSVIATAGAAKLSDGETVADEYARNAELLAALYVLHGRDGGLNLAENVLREEMAALAYRIHSGDVEDEMAGYYVAFPDALFTDVNPNSWSAGPIAYCQYYGLMNGRAEGIFDPYSTVSKLEAIAVMLRALGYDYDREQFDGDNWGSKVILKAREVGLLNVLTEDDSANMYGPATREMIAQILGVAMTLPTVELNERGRSVDDPDTRPLLEKTLEVETGVERDINGRPITVYSKNGMVLLTEESAVAVKTYQGEVKDTTVAADLAGYAVVTDGGKTTKGIADTFGGADISVVYRNGATASKLSGGGTVAAAIAGLSGKNTAMEIYADGKVITNIVVIDTQIGIVAKTEADGRAVYTVGASGPEIINADECEVEDGSVVIYTQGEYNGGSVAEVQGAAMRITGKMIQYTTQNPKYTIVTAEGDKGEYELSDSLVLNDIDDEALRAFLGTDNVDYYIYGGKIVYAKGPEVSKAPEIPETVYSGFAVVVDVSFKGTKYVDPNESADAVDAPEFSDVTVYIQAVTDKDGLGEYTMKAIELTQEQAEELNDRPDLKAGGYTRAKPGDWVVVVGGVYYKITDKYNDGDVRTGTAAPDERGVLLPYIKDIIYACRVDESGEIGLYDVGADESVDRTRVEGDITATTVTAAVGNGDHQITAIIDSSTRFVVYDKAAGTWKAVSKSAISGSVSATESVTRAIKIGEDGDGAPVCVYVVEFVYVADGYTAAAANAGDPTDALIEDALDALRDENAEYVYIDAGNETVGVDSEGARIYTYSAVCADGGAKSLTLASSLNSGGDGSGIYKLTEVNGVVTAVPAASRTGAVIRNEAGVLVIEVPAGKETGEPAAVYAGVGSRTQTVGVPAPGAEVAVVLTGETNNQAVVTLFVTG